MGKPHIAIKKEVKNIEHKLEKVAKQIEHKVEKVAKKIEHKVEKEAKHIGNKIEKEAKHIGHKLEKEAKHIRHNLKKKIINLSESIKKEINYIEHKLSKKKHINHKKLINEKKIEDNNNETKSNINILCEYRLSNTQKECYKNNYPQDLYNMNNSDLQNHWSTIGCNENRNIDCPSQQLNTGMYIYKGCFNDKSIRAIPKFNRNVSSIDECAKIAENNNQNVFGLQNNGQCFTGLNHVAAYQYGPNFNKLSCPPMGGEWTNQVYTRTQNFAYPYISEPELQQNNFSSKENFSNIKNKKYNRNFILLIIVLLIIIIIILLYLK